MVNSNLSIMTKKKKNKKWRWVLLGLLLLVLVFAAYKYFNKTDDSIAVEIEKVKKRDIYETVTASGKIFPEKEVKISSDVSGEVVELYVVEGDSVKAGQILAKIDPDAYVSAVERGKATVNNAKAQEAMAKSQIEGSSAQINQIKAQLANAENIHKRNTDLYDDGVISAVEYQQSEATLAGLKANLSASEASKRSAQQSAEGANFGVQSAQATLKELNTSLSKTTIKSPVDGVISNLSIEQGERVVGTMQMAGTELMRIANLDAIQVKVDVSENDVLRVSVGDTVDIEVDAYLDKKFLGIVTHIANSASNLSTGLGSALSTDQVTNFEVEVRIYADSYKSLMNPGKSHPFRPGMSASVTIYTDKVEKVIALPIQSVTVRLEDEKETKKKQDYKEVVFVMQADTAKMIEVKTGIQDDEYIQILEGIDKEIDVISGPYSAISDELEQGLSIKILEDDDNDK